MRRNSRGGWWGCNAGRPAAAARIGCRTDAVARTARVMAGEGRLPTTSSCATKERRGWLAFAGHDTGSACHVAEGHSLYETDRRDPAQPKKMRSESPCGSLRSQDGIRVERLCRFALRRHGREVLPGIGAVPGKLGLGSGKCATPCGTPRSIDVSQNVTPLEVSGANPAAVSCGAVFQHPARDISRNQPAVKSRIFRFRSARPTAPGLAARQPVHRHPASCPLRPPPVPSAGERARSEPPSPAALRPCR